jgi:outer membrane biosynthesis protein TonB
LKEAGIIMSFEEDYLDKLLKSVTNPEPKETDNEEVKTLESIDNVNDIDIDIDGLDEAISKQTQTALAAEFNPDETTIEDDMLALADMLKYDNVPLDEIPLDEEEPALDELNLDAEEPTLDELNLDAEEPAPDDVVLDEAPLDEVVLDEAPLDEVVLDEAPLDDVVLDEAPLDEVSLDDVMLDTSTLDEIPLDDTPQDDVAESSKPTISANDSLEDILSMLDDDSELAEINDMLKKSDNNEPVQDDMMSMLTQMADDEAKSVNEGVQEVDDDDGGVPLPAYSSTVSVDADDDDDEDDDNEDDDNEDDSDDIIDDDTDNTVEATVTETSVPSVESEGNKADGEKDSLDELSDFKGQNIEEKESPKEESKKEKPKKEKAKKEKAPKEEAEKPKKSKAKKEKAKKGEEANEEAKQAGKLSKLFDLLTQDLVDEPTEEELAAEKQAKEAKKAEDKTKKDEEKAKKDEEKKAKAEEKEAAKKAKAEEDAKKKKEKADAAKAKKEAKAAKKAAEATANKGKKIPKKNIIAAAILGITVFGAIMIATNILAKQGFLRTARKAYYNQDYMAVYQATYGMELNNDESDGLIKNRSEVIMKLQRRLDSYQNNVKMGRELEALDALIQGLATYDYINSDAEQYGVMSEVNEIKDEILNILQTQYGLDETGARAIMNEEDDTAYTVDLNDVINGR